MEFNPANPVIKLCIQAMAMEENNQPEKAKQLFMDAFNTASNDFEKYLACYYLSRHQNNTSDQLKYLESALKHATVVNDISVHSALSSLYKRIAECYLQLGNKDEANKYLNKAEELKYNVNDPGPFYHGTKAALQKGDLLTPGGQSNYKSDLIMNHIYFTALVHGAGLAAALSKGEGSERVYIVEPTGPFENDPNVTDKKFPGNPTRSYRSTEPLKIVGEVTDWDKISPEELQKWRERLDANKGEIIN